MKGIGKKRGNWSCNIFYMARNSLEMKKIEYKPEDIVESRNTKPQERDNEGMKTEEEFAQEIVEQGQLDQKRIEEIRSSLGISSENKRFKLSREDFARDRIQAIKDTIKEIKKERPEILSFCMFGSMTKGTAKLESDIDGFLLVDAEKTKEDMSEGDFLEDEKTEYGRLATFFRGEAEADYKNLLIDRMKSKIDLPIRDFRDIRVRPISREIIDRHIRSLEAAESDDIPPSTNLTAMFHLDVGGGIKTYRKYLIEKLSKMGEKGEKIWNRIITSTESMEQNFNWNTDKRYPRNLEEAKKTYGQM